MKTSVVFTELATGCGHKVGVASLNSPQTLNGLSLEMCDLLTEKLSQWALDPSVVMVIMRGEGDKAFSAGGDLHGLYASMQANTTGHAWNNEHARRFFETEYRLDYTIHTYPKPILCWASGIVMGGGVGLMMGASHRVMTETTRFAMPEISIGLFPDVGGTWMLSRLPAGVGQFLALTGAQLGARDCQWLGLSDYIVPSNAYHDLIARIVQAHWSTDPHKNDVLLRRILQAFPVAEPLAQGPLERHILLIRSACDTRDFSTLVSSIQALSDHPDPWIQKAVATFAAGSPGSARLSFALLQQSRTQSLADVFRNEYIAALHCCAQGDFQEGIRALLIDKDKTPVWNPGTYEQADSAWVQPFFVPPWPPGQAHPLADLGH